MSEEIPMQALALQWKKLPKRTDVVSRVDPGSSVQLESLDPRAEGKTAVVYYVPEAPIRRLLYKVRLRSGAPHTPLTFNAWGKHGPLTQSWMADQRPPPYKPSTFFAAVEGVGLSGPLTVTNSVIFTTDTTVKLDSSLSGAGLAALGAPPLPVTVKAGASREMKIWGKAYGVNDPSVELRLLSTGHAADPLRGLLEEQLAIVGEIFEVREGELWDLLRADYEDCLENPGDFSMDPARLTVGEDEEHEVALTVNGTSTGRALGAVGVFDTELEQLISVSDLMVLGSAEDGSMFVGS